VFQRFKVESLKLRLKICLFDLQGMEYFGYTWLSATRISVSTKKVEAVANWLVPTTQKLNLQFLAVMQLLHIFHPSIKRPYGSFGGLTADIPPTEGNGDASLFGSL
jgi:hypothetical protein